MTHTSGPWTWIVHDYSSASLLGPNEDHVLTVSLCKNCQDHQKDKGWEWDKCSTVNEANAKLIASAPDLLKKVEELEAERDHWRRKYTDAMEQSIDNETKCQQQLERATKEAELWEKRANYLKVQLLKSVEDTREHAKQADLALKLYEEGEAKNKALTKPSMN